MPPRRLKGPGRLVGAGADEVGVSSGAAAWILSITWRRCASIVVWVF
jgi:hypothetical protein